MLDFRIDVAINAPPDSVWAVMRDIERWPEWTPTVRKIRRLDRGSLAVGSRAVIWQPKLPPAKWKVTELDDARRSFTWETLGPGMRLQARHSVEGTGNTSRATLSIQFSGLLGPLFARITRDLNDRYLALEANGLKERSGDSPITANPGLFRRLDWCAGGLLSTAEHGAGLDASRLEQLPAADFLTVLEPRLQDFD